MRLFFWRPKSIQSTDELIKSLENWVFQFYNQTCDIPSIATASEHLKRSRRDIKQAAIASEHIGVLIRGLRYRRQYLLMGSSFMTSRAKRVAHYEAPRKAA